MIDNINPQIIGGEWWQEGDFVSDQNTHGFYGYRWVRKRVLRFVGINDGRYMFSIYPKNFFVLYTDEQVHSMYHGGTLRPFVLKGGKA